MRPLSLSLMLILLILTALPTVIASIGIGTLDLKDNAVEVMDESSKIIKFTLQNTEKYNLTASVGVNGKTVRIVEPQPAIFNLPPGSLDTTVYVNVSAPPGARIGDEFSASISMGADLEGGGGGTVGVIPSLSRAFNVRIVKNPDKFYLAEFLTTMGMTVAILAVFALFLFVGLKISLKRVSKRKKL